MHTVAIDTGTRDRLRDLAVRHGLPLSDVLSHACRVLSTATDDAGDVIVFVWREPAVGVRRSPESRVERLQSEAAGRRSEQAGPVGIVELDEPTHALVRFAARVFGVSEAEVIGRAVRAFSDHAESVTRPARDPWTAVPVYGECAGQRVEGEYLPATRRLTVKTGPVAGQAFRSPSGGARAVVAALKPERAATQTNGWRFWRIMDTDERLEVLR